jgi:tetratricopeptide (TPR) repeat protein
VDAFRELGARWELASALTSRGIARRLGGRLDEAVEDLREAFRLVRELEERSIITWTAAAYAKALAASGDPGAARRVLEEAAPLATSGGPAPETWLDHASVEILLAEGERDAALEQALEMLESDRAQGEEKDAAARVWWIAEIFGAETAGGQEEVDRARDLLERTQSRQALAEPGLALQASPRVSDELEV